ncbi:MAG: hypothetical protein NTY10_00425 [Candidatus Omnitrophica bacterium]|nr:hypothetical protein [Candidatus Omnitrophota bacterium]
MRALLPIEPLPGSLVFFIFGILIAGIVPRNPYLFFYLAVLSLLVFAVTTRRKNILASSLLLLCFLFFGTAGFRAGGQYSSREQ